MNWYKKYSQQIEMDFENIPLDNKIPKNDPKSIDRIINSLASMLFNNQISDDLIRNVLGDLKNLKDKNIIKFPIGMAIKDKFDTVCKYLNISGEDIIYRKKIAFDRLRRIMEEII